MRSTPGSRIDEPSRDGATEDDRPEAIGSRGGLGRRDSCARATRSLESHAGGTADAVDVRDASCVPVLALRDWFWNESLATACRATGDLPVALRRGRLECRCRLRPCHRSALGCFVPRICIGGVEGLHAGRRGGVAIDRHARWIEGALDRSQCQAQQFSLEIAVLHVLFGSSRHRGHQEEEAHQRVCKSTKTVLLAKRCGRFAPSTASRYPPYVPRPKTSGRSQGGGSLCPTVVDDSRSRRFCSANRASRSCRLGRRRVFAAQSFKCLSSRLDRSLFPAITRRPWQHGLIRSGRSHTSRRHTTIETRACAGNSETTVPVVPWQRPQPVER